MSIAAPFNTPATVTALSINLEEATTNSPPLSTEQWEAMAELRDKLADGEKIGWWVVYNGDPGRDYPVSESDYSDEEGEAKTETGETSAAASEEGTRNSAATSTQPSMSEARLSQLSTTSGPGAGTSTGIAEQGSSANRMRSPTGGRIPPPVPPSTLSKTPSRSPGLPTSKSLPIRTPLPEEEQKSKEAKEMKSPKSPGLRKKLFGGKKDKPVEKEKALATKGDL